MNLQLPCLVGNHPVIPDDPEGLEDCIWCIHLSHCRGTRPKHRLDLDYQAVGVISLYMKEDLWTAIVLTYEDPIISLAQCTLTNLATLYATTGPTSQFYLFKDIVNWHLGSGDPLAKIAHLIELFTWLSGVGLVLPENLWAMLLCTSLGNNYTSLITIPVHTIGTTEFTPTKLIPMILAESQQ